MPYGLWIEIELLMLAESNVLLVLALILVAGVVSGALAKLRGCGADPVGAARAGVGEPGVRRGHDHQVCEEGERGGAAGGVRWERTREREWR